MQWSKFLRQYKFTIYYTLGKENGRVDIISKKSNHLEMREIFSHSIFMVNRNGLLWANKHKFGMIICIMQDD